MWVEVLDRCDDKTFAAFLKQCNVEGYVHGVDEAFFNAILAMLEPLRPNFDSYADTYLSITKTAMETPLVLSDGEKRSCCGGGKVL